MEPSSTPPNAARAGIGMVIALLVFLAALLFGAWGVWQVARGVASGPDGGEADEALAQRVVTLERSDQISREANVRLQQLLSEREEEIAGLRADVDFYERLVGATGQRRGLSVHALRVQPQPGGAYRFNAILTQNLNRGSISAGTLTLEVEGSQAGQLRTLGWDELRQKQGAEPIRYSFRYFEDVDGDIFLPEGFTPVRIRARLQPNRGAAVVRELTWAEATAPPATPGLNPAAAPLS